MSDPKIQAQHQATIAAQLKELHDRIEADTATIVEHEQTWLLPEVPHEIQLILRKNACFSSNI